MNIIEKNFVFSEDKQYHASTLICDNNNIIISCFGGTKEGHTDTKIYLANKIAKGWNISFFDKADACPLWNPVLYNERDNLYIYYKKGESVHSWKTILRIFSKNTNNWSEEQILPNDRGIPQGPVKNKLIKLSDNSFLAGSSIEGESYWKAYGETSKNLKQWSASEVPIDFSNTKNTAIPLSSSVISEDLWENDLSKIAQWQGLIQPTVWESENGVCHMLCRSSYGYIFRSDSYDYGHTWSKAYPIAIPNNNSGLDLCYHNKKLYLVCNPVEGNWGERSPLSLYISEDNGETWQLSMHLENEEGEFSYPAIIGENQYIHITYTWNRKNIIYTKMEI